MKAIATEHGAFDLESEDLRGKLDDLQRELGDIKRILVLIQHRAVIASLLESERGWRTWARRFLSWFRGKEPAAAK